MHKFYWSHFYAARPELTENGPKVLWNAWPNRMCTTWPEFIDHLTQHFLTPPRFYENGTPVDPNDAKKCTNALSGAYYQDRTPRSKENVLGHNLFALDIDNKNPDYILTLTQAIELFKDSPYQVCIYTSWSHTDLLHKFRILLPTSEPYHTRYHEHFYEWALDHLGLRPWAPGIDRETCCKTAQVYFYGNSWLHEPFITAKDGIPLTVPHPNVLGNYPIPEKLYKASDAVGGGLGDMSGQDWWKQYAIDFTTLNMEELMKRLLGSKKVGHRRDIKEGWKCRCHCPWPEEHTRGVDGEDAYITERDDKWPSFKCGHSCHEDLSLADICELAGVELLKEFAEELEKAPITPVSGSLTFIAPECAEDL